jgi:hypothetical protein
MDIEEMKKLLDALSSKNEVLAKENEDLRSVQGRRPKDALIVGMNMTFPKGSHKELVGKKLGLSVPVYTKDGDLIGQLYSTAIVKLSQNGNTGFYMNGWMDHTKLGMDLDVIAIQPTAEAKATKSFSDSVGLQSSK